MRETVRYGQRGEGSLTRADAGNWYSILSVQGKQHEFSCGTPDLKLAKKFHKGKLDELVRGQFQSPAVLKLQFGTLLNDRIADYQLKWGARPGGLLEPRQACTRGSG